VAAKPHAQEVLAEIEPRLHVSPPRIERLFCGALCREWIRWRGFLRAERDVDALEGSQRHVQLAFCTQNLALGADECFHFREN